MKITIKCQHMNHIEDKEVDAYKTRSPDLVVNRGYVKWSITHIPTGYAIIDLIDSRKRALQAANMLAELADWGKITLGSAMEFYNANKDSLLEIKRFARG